ncbi:MAG: YidC/Oxa1 family membrane protein insertase [Candidatus Taylorbacteria bacterium]|nr:YidC/Oxa1 family membrane protein insertase [Candidatus Taylorbacteria bacterium]
MYNTLIYTPLYNGLVFLMNILPWVDAGVAVLLFTVIVKLILSPLSYKSVKTQVNMKQIEPELNALKVKFTDKQEQARQVMALYKAKGINPFSGFFLILIQLPIIFALYSIFWQSGLPHINVDILYSFVGVPAKVNMFFLGLVDISQKSIIISLCAAITQFFQIRYSMPKPAAPKDGDVPSFKTDFARSMSFQMQYIMPIVVFFISYSISAAVAIYWSVSNLFMIGQEVYIRRRLKK